MNILHYPKRNRIGVQPVWIARQLVIVAEIDLLHSPVTLADYLRRPMVRRGRWLLRCWDAQARRYRQFYSNAFRETWRPEMLKIGEYDSAGRLIALSEAFEQTIPDRARLELVLQRLKHEKGIFVYSDGLRVIS